MRTQTLRRYFEEQFYPALECAANVKRSYVQAVDKFIAFRAADPPIGEITRQDVADFRRWQTAGRNLRRSSANSYAKRLLHILRTFNGWEPGNGQGEPMFKVAGDGTLAAFFRDVYCVERALQPESARQVEMAIRNLSRWVGHEVRLDELCDDLFNRWVMHLQSRYRPKTAKTRRANVLGVWQYAVDTDHVEPESEPGRVRIVKVPRPVPECWSMAELATLLEATRAEQFDRHMRNGVHLGRLLFAFVNVCYDTALRTQDMFDLRTEQITDDGILAVVQRKTQTGHVCRIRPATVEAVRATYPPNREFVFAWAYRRETFWNWWRELLIRAGLPTGRRNGPQKIRRSSATYLERVSPGMAGIHLGHLTPGLALRHYVNSAVAYEARPLPPAIVKGGGA